MKNVILTCIFSGCAILTLCVLKVILCTMNKSVMDLMPIKCFFHEITGYYCPGCGGTRALNALINGDFMECMKYNLAVMYAGAVFVVISGSAFVCVLTKGKVRALKFSTTYVYVFIGIILVQWIFKNILLVFWGIRVI